METDSSEVVLARDWAGFLSFSHAVDWLKDHPNQLERKRMREEKKKKRGGNKNSEREEERKKRKKKTIIIIIINR